MARPPMRQGTRTKVMIVRSSQSYFVNICPDPFKANSNKQTKNDYERKCRGIVRSMELDQGKKIIDKKQ